MMTEYRRVRVALKKATKKAGP